MLSEIMVEATINHTPLLTLKRIPMRPCQIKKPYRAPGKRRNLWTGKRLVRRTRCCLLCALALLAAGTGIWAGASAQFDSRNSNYFDSPWKIFAGLSPGAMNGLTDIGGKQGQGKTFMKDLRMSAAQPAAGICLGALWNDILALRLEINGGSLAAADSVLQKAAPGSYGRYNRNLHFRTSITEALLTGECYFLNLLRLNQYILKHTDRDDLHLQPARALDPYLLGGIGLFHFNPRAMLGNAWFFLHELHTEGRGLTAHEKGKNYSLLQCSIPVGLGLRFRLFQKWHARFELAYRLLFTDYLDDTSGFYIDPENFYKYLPPEKAAVAEALADRRKIKGPPIMEASIRGNPTKNDAYLSAMLKLNLNLGSN